MLILNITDPTLASSRTFLYEPQRIVSMVGFISPIGIQHRPLQSGGNGKSRNSYFLIHLATFTVQMFPWFSFVWYSAQLMEWGSHKHPFCLRRKQNEYFFSSSGTNGLFLHLSSKTMGLYLDFIPQLFEDASFNEMGHAKIKFCIPALLKVAPSFSTLAPSDE